MSSENIILNEKNDESFIKYHFSTDFQIGSWGILFSSILFLAVSGYYVYVGYNEYDDDFTQVNFLILLISSLLFVIASALFVYQSYPKNLISLYSNIQTIDSSKLNCIERYFIGNYFLISMWIIVIAILPVVVYVIWAYTLGVINLSIFIFFLIGIVIVYGTLFLWIVSAFPESLQANNGSGTTYFVDYICFFDFLFDKKDFVKKNLSPDFLAGSWIFAILIMAGLVFSSYLLYAYYQSPDLWVYIMFFISSLILSAASLLFVYGSYPNNIMGSNLFYQITCCEKAIEPTEEEIENMLRYNERQTLLQNNNHNHTDK